MQAGPMFSRPTCRHRFSQWPEAVVCLRTLAPLLQRCILVARNNLILFHHMLSAVPLDALSLYIFGLSIGFSPNRVRL